MTKRLLVVLLGSLFPLVSLAYIPPSEFMLKSFVRKRADLKGLRVRSVVTQLDGEKMTGIHFKQVTLFDPATRVLKSRAYDDAGKELFAIEKSADSFTATEALLIDPSLPAVSKALKQSGVPVRTEEELVAMATEEERQAAEVTFLSRWKGSSAWLVGPDKREAFAPQLWFEKDSFLPIRLIQRTDDGKLDIRFQGYRFFAPQVPYPRTVTLVRATDKPHDEGILRDELQELMVNPELTEMKAPIVAGFTAAGNAAEPELRELIRLYYAHVR